MVLYPEQKKKIFLEWFIIICMLLFSACSSSGNQDELKFDPALKNELRKTEQNNPDKIIEVFFRTEKDFTREMVTELNNTGIITESVIGGIVTAKGTSGQIRKAASLTFIVKIELSQKRESGKNGGYYEEIFY
jgi:hypothetical protein